MQIKVLADAHEAGRAAAEHAAHSLCRLLREKETVRLVGATGVSQFGFLETLTAKRGIDWARVELFHLDEYVGLPMTHPASFRKFLLERLVHKTGITRFHPLNGELDPATVAMEVGRELRSAAIDLAFVGIGENGHLAFNDPPADFEADEPYIVVELDQACRQQQVGEGWFSTIADVPMKAISMSIKQIIASDEIIAVVPDARKAGAVKNCFECEISPLVPASILRTHHNTAVYLDRDSASFLSPKTLASFSGARTA